MSAAPDTHMPAVTHQPWGEYIEIVACALLGEPNASLSKPGDLRFGNNGSVSINTVDGTWYDHEAQIGSGVLNLIERKLHLTGRAAFDWMRSIGCQVEAAELSGAKPNGTKHANAPAKPNKKLLASHDYLDEAGALIFQARRIGYCKADGTLEMGENGKPQKTFSQRRPDPEKPGQWIYNLAGVAKALPYRLPEVMEAIANGHSVFVVEGEAKADLLAEWKLTATCNAEGAGKWTAAHAAYLRDADVVILPDNDEAGRKHAAGVAASLQGIATRIRIVELPGLSPKGDIVDWAKVGGTREQLDDLVEWASDWKPAAANQTQVPADNKSADEDGPIPLYPPLPPAAPFPVEALGDVLSKATLAIARKVQVPEVIAAQSVLAASALAAQTQADVMMPYGDTRPLSLFLITVAPSGDRKTTADNAALAPIRKYEDALKEKHQTEHERWDVEHAAWTAERKKIEGDKKLERAERENALTELGPKPPQPLEPFLTMVEPTVEGVIKIWPIAPAALGIFSAEGGQFIGGYGMSPDHRLKTAAALSGMWYGAKISRLRVIDGSTILLGRRLCLHLMVQPDAAAMFLSDPILRNQGLLSRILAAQPESLAGTRLYRNTEHADETTIREYSDRILSILQAPWPLAQGTRNELDPPTLSLDAGAFAAWKEFYNGVEIRCGQYNELAVIGDFAAKAAEQAARIAGVLTIVEDRLATEIKAATMRDAVTIADWYVNETLRLQQGSRMDPNLARAQRLLEWIQQRGAEVGFREIVTFGPPSERSKDAAEQSLRILLAHNQVRVVSKRPYCVAALPSEAM